MAQKGAWSMAATFTKLKDNSWGLRIKGSLPDIGSTVEVVRANGSRSQQCVGAVVWSGDGVHLVRIGVAGTPVQAQAPRQAAPRAQQLQLTSVSQWQRHVAGLTRPACSGCPDGCWGCDSAEGAMDAWN